MTYAAKILADSNSPEGVRLTTMEVVIPRIVLAEFNTHRMFSRNSASSRAIPIHRMLKRVHDNPFIPSHWGANQKGMQANGELGPGAAACCEREWLQARDYAIKSAQMLADLDLHKQIANRLLEPFMWHTVIVTATEWDNFFAQRCHPDAHPDIRKPAELMREALDGSIPQQLEYRHWHLPLLQEDELKQARSAEPCASWPRVSIGRCARVSYLTHEGVRDTSKDIELCDQMLRKGHMSPFEHVARPRYGNMFCGNFRGWRQYRKDIEHEENRLGQVK